MTKPDQLHSVAVLVPGHFNDHAVERIDRTFRRVKIERADPALVTDDMRRDDRSHRRRRSDVRVRHFAFLRALRTA